MSEVEVGSEVDVVPRPPAPEPHPVLQWVQQTRRNPRFALGAVAVVALSAGVALWRAGQDETPARPPAEANAAFVTTTTAVAAPAVVHVVGAVRAPGVVELGAHARVVDAIGAAGGAILQAAACRVLLRAHSASTDEFLFGFARASVLRVVGGTVFVVIAVAAWRLPAWAFLLGFGAVYVLLEVVSDLLLVQSEKKQGRIA